MSTRRRDLCGCGRPRATAADLERWRATAGGRIDPAPAPLPAAELWASMLCWTMPGVRCGMRKRWASDVHIGEARRVFELHAAVHGGRWP